MQRFVRWGGAFVLVLTGVCGKVSAQELHSTVGVTSRFGLSASSESDLPIGIGFEIDLWPTGTLVPDLRLDDWQYGIACAAFPSSCPSGVTTITAGIKARAVGASRVVPYVGTDVGRMRWTSGASGVAMRLRVGADIRLIRHVMLNLDGGLTRFVEVSSTEGGQLHNQLVGLSVGLKLWA